MSGASCRGDSSHNHDSYNYFAKTNDEPLRSGIHHSLFIVHNFLLNVQTTDSHSRNPAKEGEASRTAEALHSSIFQGTSR